MLWLFAILITLKWEAVGCPGGYFVMRGTPVPANQPKAEVQLYVIKQGAEMPAGSCTTQIDTPPGSYVYALSGGQSPTPPNPWTESNRCVVLVYSDSTPMFTDCPDTVQPGIKPPTNFRFP